MANEDYRNEENQTTANVDPNVDQNIDTDVEPNFMEETAAELTAPQITNRAGESNTQTGSGAGTNTNAKAGGGIGFLALILSILSLFVLPVLMGAAGIILGFIARRRGAKGLGAWAIGLGAISIIVGMFILPFF